MKKSIQREKLKVLILSLNKTFRNYDAFEVFIKILVRQLCQQLTFEQFAGHHLFIVVL